MTIDSSLFFQRRWKLWESAKSFPDLVSECDYTLEFTLGRDDFGFEYGSNKKLHAGPALDLTGATVKLQLQKLSRKPSLVLAARGEEWTSGYTMCTLDGTITDAANGEVEFDMADTDCADIGYFIGEIEVTDSSGNIIVPGHVRFHFLEKLI